jgi:hypothetical protein
MDIEEMLYLEGGAVSTVNGTAKALKSKAAGWMAAWGALAGGYGYAAAVAAATGVGVGVAVIAGIGAGYCAFSMNEYRQAYNYFSTKSQSSSKKYYLKTISFVGIITGVDYGVA